MQWPQTRSLRVYCDPRPGHWGYTVVALSVVSGSNSDDSEATDREEPTPPHSKYKPQKHTISFKKKMGGREGVAVRPPVVPPLPPPTHNPSHPPTSHPRMGLAATPHHNPLSYPMVAQLPPDTEIYSPSCKSCLILLAYLLACFLLSFFLSSSIFSSMPQLDNTIGQTEIITLSSNVIDRKICWLIKYGRKM